MYKHRHNEQVVFDALLLQGGNVKVKIIIKKDELLKKKIPTIKELCERVSDIQQRNYTKFYHTGLVRYVWVILTPL